MLFRDLAQRILCERNNAATRPALEKLALDESAPRKTRLHALWTLIGTGSLAPDFHQKLLGHADAGFRAWGVRAAGNFGQIDPAIVEKIVSLASDPTPDVQLQVAIAARKVAGVDALPVLVKVLATCGDDKLIPHIVWQNLHPLLENHSDQFLKLAKEYDLKTTKNLANIMPRVTERILAKKKS